MATSHEGPLNREKPVVEATVIVRCSSRSVVTVNSLKDLTGGPACFKPSTTNQT